MASDGMRMTRTATQRKDLEAMKDSQRTAGRDADRSRVRASGVKANSSRHACWCC